MQNLITCVLTVLTLVVLSLGSLAHGQFVEQIIRVKVPFEFTANQKIFPAGEYWFVLAAPDWLEVRNARAARCWHRWSLIPCNHSRVVRQRSLSFRPRAATTGWRRCGLRVTRLAMNCPRQEEPRPSRHAANQKRALLAVAGINKRIRANYTTGQPERRTMPNEMVFELLIPDTMPKSVGYSQLAVVRGGIVVFIAGQVAVDKSGNVVGKGDFKAQIQQVFENLQAAVEAAGGSFNEVVKLNSYFVDLSHLPDFREIRDKYINVKNPPTSTAIQVPRLFRPEFLVEVEAVAVVPPKSKPQGRLL